MSATATAPYVVNCAGCRERRAFATVAELADWTRRHRCWQEEAQRAG